MPPRAEPPSGPKPREQRDPEQIGHFRVLERIGEGGMGVVYKAEQLRPIHRLVAIKLIKWGMDTKEVIARFEVERQALALMDHLGVAKVLEAGTTDGGRPYFVMELVRGVPITEYCDQNKLSVPERLELFRHVCLAVQHAHQKGIIHRDLKPSNVLVTIHDGAPLPKIIDFGIAKAIHARLTEKTLFTQLKHFIGTPEYMSPEQAEVSALDIDTRSDIYSLGVILYELLTGVTPFAGSLLRNAAYVEMQRIIREVDPPKPSTKLSTSGAAGGVVATRRRTDLAKLGRSLRGDLDWIVMRALEKDRNRRYATASDFASDVARHLDNEPVSAARPSALYRFRKIVARHRVTTIAILAAFAVLAVGLTIIWSLYTSERISRGHARLAEQEQTRLRQQAEAALRAIEEEKRKVVAAEGLANARANEAQAAAVVANLYAADAAIALEDAGTAQRRLDAIPQAARDWEWFWLSGLADAATARVDIAAASLNVHWHADRFVYFNPDGVHEIGRTSASTTRN